MSDKGSRWLDEPKNVSTIWWLLCAVCALLVAVDLFRDRKVHFDLESWPGFYAAVGFIAFYAIVIAGKHLRKILMRDEDYYDR